MMRSSFDMPMQGFAPPGDAQSIEFAGGNPAGMRQPMGLGGSRQRPMPGQPGLGQLGNALGSNMWGRGDFSRQANQGMPQGVPFQQGGFQPPGQMMPRPFEGGRNMGGWSKPQQPGGGFQTMGGGATDPRWYDGTWGGQAGGQVPPGTKDQFLGGQQLQPGFSPRPFGTGSGIPGQPFAQPKQPGLFAGQPFAPRGGGQFQQMGSQNRRQWPGGSMY